MNGPNKYIVDLKPYALASHKIWSVPAEKRAEILKLDWNESTLSPSPKVKERLLELLAEPDFFNLYPTTNNERLIEDLAEYIGISRDCIQYFGSSDSLHEYICKVFLESNDTVLMVGPSYDNFRLTCQANGARVLYYKYQPDFTFDYDKFEECIGLVEPAMVYICNPNNPTGNLHSLEYIEHLLVKFPKLIFLVDEAYAEFSGMSAKDLVLKHDNLLISRTMSKAFALANFRVGYLVSSKKNIDLINKIRNPKNLSTIAQEAAIAAIEDADYMRKQVADILKGREYFLEKAKAFSEHFTVIPSHGNYMLVKFKTYQEKMALIGHLSENDIFVRDTMQDAIVQNCFRITAGTIDQMKRVLTVIADYYNA